MIKKIVTKYNFSLFKKYFCNCDDVNIKNGNATNMKPPYLIDG